MFNFRTDMADERRDLYKKANNLENEIPGIKSESWQEGENIKISKVIVENEEGENAIGKPIGEYVTIDIKKLKIANDEEIEKASKCVTKELNNLINKHIKKEDGILIIGLGNAEVTPDALGPKVVSEVDITRHLLTYAPEYLEEGTRAVSAVAPGVLGTTGIETLEIVKGLVDNVKPKLLIVIDSLASKSIERISSTVQIADTGIIPGAGVGNTRKELSNNTLGIPVIAIGVPMVVDLATITDDCLDLFITKLQEDAKSNEFLNNLKEKNNYEEIKEALMPNDFNMIVTPKEIDDLIENMGSVVARGINFSIN